MKKILVLQLLLFYCVVAFANVNTDSLAYQLQRQKINGMLAQRTQKFGQYDQSLGMHTGIFGFQTKKDIRRSNDILMDIVKTDDDIYKQIKILLDYRVFQQTQVENHSREAEESNIGFMTTINKLRNQIDLLKADAEKQNKADEKTKHLFIIAIIFLLMVILYLAGRKRSIKA